jgi:dienelactone hydrolase
MQALSLLPALFLTLAQAPPAGSFAPPKAESPAPTVLASIQERTDKLGKALATLRQQGIGDPFLADVQVYHKAAMWIVRHGEFYQKEAANWTLEVLDRGLLRASQQLRGEAPWLNIAGTTTARAYRSRVDGSVQPYLVTFPADYGKDPRRKWRVDVVLHGRAPAMTEVAFLHQHADRPAPVGQAWVQIDIYGRGNNAYRWAGETDVYEAIDNFLAVERYLRRDGLLDPARFVLRGYSMGGAGTWQLGLHRPDRWCLLGPGAGFVTTHGYAPLPKRLPSFQEKCLTIYDALDYVDNAFNVPVVAYNGSKDPQKQSADLIEGRLKQLGIPMTHLVGPDLGHAFPAEWRQKAEAEYTRHVAQGRPEFPKRVRFVTYTLKYPSCFWLDLIGLEQHYERAAVEAEVTDDGFTLKTANVRALALAMPPGATREKATINIDGQKLMATPYQRATSELFLYLEKRDGDWTPALPERLTVDRLRRPQKTAGLTGPIDDAFTAPFLCVRGTGEPWHEATQRYAEADLQRFQAEWSKFLRGDLPVKDDTDVTAEELSSRHLILFGDPSSNSILSQALPRLPLKWSKERIAFAGNDYDAASHVPVLIYPSPLAADRYVVLNSGHTFHAAEFQGTNALLFPRLGDHAILKLTGGEKDPLAAEVARAGLFDDFWRVPKSEPRSKSEPRP